MMQPADDNRLLAKLGWKPGMEGWAVGLPAELQPLLPLSDTTPLRPDLILAFVTERHEIAAMLAAVLPYYHRGGRLWFAYPKKTGSIRSDVSRDAGWGPMAEAGLLAVTQVAIDGTWSALRFRLRDEIPRLTRMQDVPGA